MIATTGSSGMVDVQARIAAIQSRVQSFVSRPVVATATAEAPARPASFAQELSTGAAFPMTGTVGGAAAGPVGAGTAVGAGAAPDGTVPAASGAWVDKLPAAGRPWAGAIQQAATEAGIDPALLASLVRHESNFDPAARSHAGATGLAQLMPGTAAGLGVDPSDPLDNLRGGATYLKQQLDRFGSVDLALAAYNAGPNRVAQAGGVPRITETQNYVQRVMSTWEQLR